MLIAARRPLAADGLAIALGQTGDLVVRGCCYEAPKLATAIGMTSAVDAVIIDAEMFDGDAARAVDAVRALNPDVAVLLLTSRVDEALLEAVTRERVSCVSAYDQAREIVSALRALLIGRTNLPHEVQYALTQKLRRPATALPPRLTDREEQVLELAATGLTVSQIATSLHISRSTAKTHLLRVYEKLEAPNRSAAVAIALGRGLLRVSAAVA